MEIDINLILRQLSDLSDQEIRKELTSYNMAIDDAKYHVAFSSYGLANKIDQLPTNILQPNDSMLIPEPAIRGIRHSAITLFCAYTAFVYMRSNHLEKGLDQVSDNSILVTYKNIFRSGKIGEGQDTLAQYIRNSLCHGDFKIGIKEVIFLGYKGELSISITDFMKLCDQIYRLYQLAFEARMQR